MNKLLTKVAKLALGLSLAAGVGVAVGSQSKASRVDAANSTYQKLSSLSAGKEVLIVSHSSSGQYYLMDAVTAATSAGPKYIKCSLSNSKITGDYDSHLFTVSASSTNWKFSTGSNYLKWSGTSSNTAIRINTGDSNNTWTYSNGTLKFSSAARYLGVYTAGSDWRSYNSATAANYSGTGENIEFYEKVSNVAVTGVTVSPTEVTLGVGATQQLTPTVAPNDATDKSVSYSSNATGVATVSATGLITAVAAGNATITVTTTDGNKTATCAVTVTAPVAVTGVSLNKNSTSIEVGSSETLIATISPNDASNQTINWSTSDANVATVSAGVVTAVGKGTATITATTADGGYTASCTVTTTAPSSVTFTAGTDVGSTSANNSPDSVSKQGITMSCDDAAFATSEYRYYASSTLTFTSTIGNMGKIEFTGDSSKKMGDISLSSGGGTVTKSGNDATWTGDASTVVFTFSAQNRAVEVAVTIKSTEKTVSLDKTEVEIFTNDTNGILVTATVENVVSPTYSWVSSNANVTLLNANTNAVTIKPNTDSASSSVVTLTVGGTTPNLTATVDVTISVPGPGQTAGTAYTVAQARDAIDAGTGVTGVYATGIVSEIVEAYSSQYHNVTFNISADGLTSGNQLEAFRCIGSDAEFVTEGDTVVVYGNLVKYGDSTYEFSSGCEIVSRISPWSFDRLELVTSAEYDNNYYLNDTFSSTGLTVNYIEVNSNTSAERSTDVTAEAVFDADLTSTGTNKLLTATYGGHTTNAIHYNVIEKPEYDVTFGNASGSLNVNDTSVTGDGWTVTTEGTTSFTPNASYAQIGSGNNPATSITFTKTINSVVTLKQFFIDLGGFNGTAGTVTLKVGSTTVGTGSLNASNDVTVHATSYGRGTGSSTVLTITITDIAKGVKAYGIAYTAKTDAEMVSEFIADYMHMSHTTNDGSCISEGWYSEAKIAYGKLHDDQKSLFNSESQFADAKARLIAWAAANGEVFDPAAYTFTKNNGAKVLLASVIGTQNTNTITVIVIISLVSVTAIGGYFFIKRRQEN